jgi:hypothetical protein
VDVLQHQFWNQRLCITDLFGFPDVLNVQVGAVKIAHTLPWGDAGHLEMLVDRPMDPSQLRWIRQHYARHDSAGGDVLVIRHRIKTHEVADNMLMFLERRRLI